VQCDANDIDDDLDDDEDDDNGGGGGVWDKLPTWMEGLHNMATLVVNLLGIHQNLTLSDGKCRCRDDNNRYRRCRRTNVPNVDDAACDDDVAYDDDEDNSDDVVKRRRQLPCNFDLLRAF
jgi:hypothetical protein